MHSSDIPVVVVRIDTLAKQFGNVAAVDGVSLEVRNGEFFTLLGPSGCGKTTLLRCVAGFLRQDKGHVWFDDELIDDIPAHRRGTGMVFQNYAIFPHLNVFENVAYGLKARRVGKAEIRDRVKGALNLVRLSGLERRMPSQLSGGQQQRIALGRALVIEPRVLLMDEPLSNLDAKLRVEMRADIRKLQNELKITSIYVTHDQEEALTISDRVAVMNAGKVEQIDTPVGIYANPKSTFTAGFIGQTNFLEGRIESFNRLNSMAVVNVANNRIEVQLSEPTEEDHVLLAIRPENLKIIETQEKPSFSSALVGVVESVSFLGSVAEYQVRLANSSLLLVRVHEPKVNQMKRLGDKVKLHVEKEGMLAYVNGARVN